MVNEQLILQAFEQTMSPDASLIKQAEFQLFQMQKESGFTAFLLSSSGNDQLPLNIRLCCVIYLKNKIQRSWVSKNNDAIQPEEKQVVKEQLIQCLIKNCENNHIRPHLTECIRGILSNNDSWDMTSIINELLTSQKDEYIYPGLLLLFEITIHHRWDMFERRDKIDNFIERTFPIVEQIASHLVNNNDYRSNEMLYLILKSFKYSCLNNFPRYFSDLEKLDSWMKLHLFLCGKQLSKEVLELEPNDRSLDKRVKVNKWAFGNLNRFLHKYTRTTKNITQGFVDYVFVNIVPMILTDYFKVIESWKNDSLWLCESSLYYLIQFLEKCMTVEQTWPLIQPHLETIVKYVIFPCISSSEYSIELFEEDPEDYTRRYFDVNKEGSTADVASSDFIFAIGHKRFDQIDKVLPLINEAFTQFHSDPTVANAYKEEGALRMMSTLSSFLAEENSPVHGELESIFKHFVLPLLSQNKYPFLTARALEAIAIHQLSFKDMEILSKIFEMVYLNFMNSQVLPVQIEAADALKTLIISNSSIHQHISSQVPSIVEKLLKLSKNFEIDILSEVMEAFVERFADELTPFANDLASDLVQQFLSLAQNLVDNSSTNNYLSQDQDQEIQASAMLQTMTTMVMSMNKVCLIDKFMPVVKFILVNAQISFLTEAVDLMDSLALSSKTVYNQFTPQVWEIFHDVLDSFQTYAMDYFESYQIFFESIITHGFPFDGTFIPKFLEILDHVLKSAVDYNIESVLSLMVIYALSMKDIPLFEKAFQTIQNEELDIEDFSIVNLFLSGLFVKPIELLQIVESQGMTLGMMQKWFDSKLGSVFGIKLQIMAIISIFKLPDLPSCIDAFTTQLSNKLIQLTESLPEAIRKRDAMSKGDIGNCTFEDNEDGIEFFEELEIDFKETYLDEVNAFLEFHQFFQYLQQQNPLRYEQLINSLTPESCDSFRVIMEFVSQN